MTSNSITITGNLGDDPEMRFTPTGVATSRFSVGVTERYRDNSGEWKDRDTTWFTVVAWRELAENCAATLSRGNRVTVTGPMRQRSWADKTTGEKRYAYEINADEIAASLKYATAKITRVKRDAPGPDDPWASDAPGETGKPRLPADGPAQESARAAAESQAQPASETAPATGKGSRNKAGTGR